MPRMTIILLCVATVSSCGGRYVLTVGDQVAPLGGEAAVVVRLQQMEVGPLKRSVQGAALRFSIGQNAERGAFTNELGFAGTTVPAGSREGKLPLLVSCQSSSGDEISARALAYVWKKDSPAVAVDLASLGGRDSAAGAVEALGKLAAEGVHILYLTQTSPYDLAKTKAKLAEAGFPDGPLLVWMRKDYHLARVGPLNLPWLAGETTLSSRVSYLRKLLVGLACGICGSPRAADAFSKAGIRPIVIGGRGYGGPKALHLRSWAQLRAADLKG